MANIINMLEKEVAKGNVLIRRDGELVSLEKVEKCIQKDYVKGLKEGTIAFDVTFNDYAAGVIDSDFLNLPNMITQLELVLTGSYGFYPIVSCETEQCDPCMPEYTGE